MTKTLVLHPFIKNIANSRTPKSRLEEACGLAEAISLNIVQRVTVNLRAIIPSTYIGKGKVQEIADIVKNNEIKLAVMDCSLTPVQQRNLEKAWNCKVIDRTALILEIFGERAQTKEGSLQVELASLEYQKSRLVRSWTHLERQRGGFGFLGGPGETQIEIDRRLIRDRIAKIKKQLEEVKRTRGLHRKSRKKIPYPIVALVGYTNAGKSTLFNRLTGANVFAEDLLFATLDPTMRTVTLPSGNKIILSDTVGFISDLPTELVAAFHATLEEVIEADLILHVRDISSPDTKAQRDDVLEILKKLVSEQKINEATIEVLNKIDLVERNSSTEVGSEINADKIIEISATKNIGIKKLVDKIDRFLAKDKKRIKTKVPATDGKLISWFYENGENVVVKHRNSEMLIEATLSDKNIAILDSIIKKL